MEQNNSSIEIARQTLLQLSKRNKPPTPDNYRSVYDEISGVKSNGGVIELGKILQKVLLDSGKNNPKLIAAERSISLLIEKQDWVKLEEQFRKLFPSGNNNAIEVNWSVLIRTLLKQLELSHKGITLSRKKEGLSRVLTNFANDPLVLGEKIQALIRSWGNETTATVEALDTPNTEVPKSATTQVQQAPTTTSPAQDNTSNNEEAMAAKWREMMLKTFELVLIPLLEGSPEAQ